jgi:hypothetical protein
MDKIQHTILKTTTGQTFNLPVFLEQSIKDLGIMVGFDGDIGQTQQICNFTYKGNGSSVTVYNTVNTTRYGALIDAIFTINWGDGATSTLTMPVMNIDNVSLPSASHTYSTNGTYVIEVTVNSPWDVRKVKKTIEIPFVQSFGYPTDLGELTFDVPYSDPVTAHTQTYLQDYRTLTGATNSTTVTFLGIGKSRVDEKKLYGTNAGYTGVTVTSEYTGYTIDGLAYRDYEDGYTHISGVTSGTTETFFQDEIYNGMITRNEHFLGFVDDPQIFSDVFVERGQMSVMEKNFRLTEIDNTGEIDVYGNGYFKVRKQ